MKKLWTCWYPRKLFDFDICFERRGLYSNQIINYSYLKFCVMKFNKNSLWYHSQRYYPSTGFHTEEEAKADADRLLLERGYTLLNEEESKKYLILL